MCKYLSLFALPLIALPLFAGSITAFENGEAYYNDDEGIAWALPWQQVTVSIGGVTFQNVLSYALPFHVTNGSVAMLEPPPYTATSDYIHFVDGSSGLPEGYLASLQFFSGWTGGAPDLADQFTVQGGAMAFPSPESNHVEIYEWGPVGSKLGIWMPGEGQPGWSSAGVGYMLWSDFGAPEPGTLWLLLAGCGMTAMKLFMRRR